MNLIKSERKHITDTLKNKFGVPAFGGYVSEMDFKELIQALGASQRKIVVTGSKEYRKK